MKKNPHFKFLSVLSLILLIFASCVSDIDLANVSKNAKIDQSLGLPIGEANLTIKDLLDKFGLPSEIDTTQNEITYQKSFSGEYKLQSFHLNDSLPPYEKTISILDYIPSFSGSLLISPPNTPISFDVTNQFFDIGYNLNPNLQHVDSFKLKPVILSAKVDVSPELSLINPNDISVQFIFDPKYVNTFGANTSFTPSIYGLPTIISMDSAMIKAYSNLTKVPYIIRIKLKPQSVPVVIKSTSFVHLTINSTNIDVTQAWGLFKMDYSGSEKVTFPFDYDKYLPNAFLRFDNPTLDIRVNTNIGADLALKIDSVKLYNSLTPSNKHLVKFNNKVSTSRTEYVNGPTVLGQSSTSNFNILNSANSETDKLFDVKPYPNSMDFNYTVSNLINGTRKQNFITSDGKVDYTFKTKINFSFKGGASYAGVDTITSVGQNIGTSLDGVDSAILVLKIKNKIPAKAYYRMTFWKSQTDTIVAGTIKTIKNDSTSGNLFSRYEISAPQVNADGTVNANVENAQTIKIVLNKAAIDNLKLTKFIILKLDLGSEVVNGVPNPIHFTTKNSFGVKLGIFLKANTTVNF